MPGQMASGRSAGTKIRADLFAWPGDKVGFVIFQRQAVLGHGPAGDGYARGVDRLPAAGFEVMPVKQILALVNEAVGAGGRQPGQFLQQLRAKIDAVRDKGQPVVVIGTAAGGTVEQTAGDVGKEDLARIPVFELVETAAAAAIAK